MGSTNSGHFYWRSCERCYRRWNAISSYHRLCQSCRSELRIQSIAAVGPRPPDWQERLARLEARAADGDELFTTEEMQQWRQALAE